MISILKEICNIPFVTSEFLKANHFSLPPSVLKHLTEGASKKVARKGEVLVCRGDLVSGVFLVLEGVLRVYANHAGGREATLYHVKSGQICLLSLNCTFSDSLYPAQVSVESSQSTFTVVSGSKFRDLFAHETSVQQLVLTSLTLTITDLFSRLDEALLSRLRDRVLSFLLCNCDSKGQIEVTHEEIALHLGSAREAISRELSHLRQENLIETRRGKIQLLKKSQSKGENSRGSN